MMDGKKEIKRVKAYGINSEGFIVEEFSTIAANPRLEQPNWITEEPPKKYKRPKWNGTAWEEGATKGELAEIEKRAKRREKAETKRMEYGSHWEALAALEDRVEDLEALVADLIAKQK
jgi:hypothetical protein